MLQFQVLTYASQRFNNNFIIYYKMSSTAKYFGDYHTFTSRNGNPIITLQAGAGETLNIAGVTNASIVETIYSQKNSDDMGLNQLGIPQIIQHSSTSILRNQGSCISVIDSGADSYLMLGGPYAGGIYNRGGVGIFKNASNTSFIQEANILTTTYTSDGNMPYFNDINETGDIAIYADNYLAIHIYTRSGSTWSYHSNISGNNAKISGNYILVSDNQQKLSVYFLSSNVWTLQQVLLDNATAGTFILDIYNGDTAVVSSGTDIKVYTRVSTTWTLIQTIAQASAITKLSFCEKALVVCNTGRYAIYTRPSIGVTELFTSQVAVTLASIIDICTNATYVFVSTSTGVYIYQLVSGVYVLSANATTDSGAYAISCSLKYLAIGKPTNNTYGNIYIYPVSSYTNHYITTNIIDFTTADLILTSVEGQIICNPSLVVNGPITATTITASSTLNVAGTTSLIGATSIAGALTLSSTFNDPYAPLRSENFGVVADNNVDQYTAFKAFIDACCAQKRKGIIQRGIIRIDSQLVIDMALCATYGLTLEGQGKKLSRLNFTNCATSPNVLLTNVVDSTHGAIFYYPHFTNFGIYGNIVGTIFQVGKYIYTDTAPDQIIDPYFDLHIENNSTNVNGLGVKVKYISNGYMHLIVDAKLPLYIENSNSCKYSGIYTGQYPISLAGSCNNNTFENCNLLGAITCVTISNAGSTINSFNGNYYVYSSYGVNASAGSGNQFRDPFVGGTLANFTSNYVGVKLTGESAPFIIPAFPASDTFAYNAGVPFIFNVSGGTVSYIAINGTVTGLQSGSWTITTGGSIYIVYSVIPTTYTYVRA